LRAFAGIADDFDNMLFQFDRRFPARERSSVIAGFLHRILYGHFVHGFSVAAVERAVEYLCRQGMGH
jgi:tetrahydromethanopterin S-methyltransferase subunit B